MMRGWSGHHSHEVGAYYRHQAYQSCRLSQEKQLASEAFMNPDNSHSAMDN